MNTTRLTEFDVNDLNRQLREARLEIGQLKTLAQDQEYELLQLRERVRVLEKERDVLRLRLGARRDLSAG